MRRRIGDPIADEFLNEVDRAARALPRSPRKELLDDLEAHLREAVAEAGGDEARLRTIVDSLGSPDEIVAAAGPPEPRAELAGRDLVAIVLLLVGGIFAGVGWLVGLVLLLVSPAWTVGQKLLGTLVFPGGLVLPVLWLGLGAAQTCGSGALTNIQNGHAVTTTVSSTCSGGSFPFWLAVLLVVVLTVGPILTAVYLVRTGRRARPNPAYAGG